MRTQTFICTTRSEPESQGTLILRMFIHSCTAATQAGEGRRKPRWMSALWNGSSWQKRGTDLSLPAWRNPAETRARLMVRHCSQIHPGLFPYLTRRESHFEHGCWSGIYHGTLEVHCPHGIENRTSSKWSFCGP